MSTNTIPVPPALWFTEPDLARIAARRSVAAGPFANVAVDVDPDEARRTCEQIQAGSRRAERDGIDYAPRSPQGRRVLKFLEAANSLASAAAMGPSDDTGRWAARLALEIRRHVTGVVPVPAASNIRPGVPTPAASTSSPAFPEVSQRRGRDDGCTRL